LGAGPCTVGTSSNFPAITFFLSLKTSSLHVLLTRFLFSLARKIF